MGLEEYVRDLYRAVEVVRRYDGAVVAHHNDADGLASAAAVVEALRREGLDVENVPLERVHPRIVERLMDRYSGLIIFVDLGAGAAPVISRINGGRNDVVIIDHHHTPGVDDPKVLNLSTELYGITGDRDVSAAGAAYLFARTLNEKNGDLVYLAVIGAIGDSHHRFGRLEGVNRRLLEEAVDRGQVEVRATDGKEDYYLRLFGGSIRVEPFAKSLTVLGAVGYLTGGPDVGIDAVLRGPGDQYERALKELREVKERAFRRVIERIRAEGLRRSKYVQWVHVHDDFAPMGVKVIGEFCMEIRDAEFVDPNMYLAGFQNMPKEVPKLGTFDWEMVKVSFRLPSRLEERVLRGEMPGYNYIVPKAARHVGGDIDACHGYACATTFERGLEEEFIAHMDRYIEEYIKNKGAQG